MSPTVTLPTWIFLFFAVVLITAFAALLIRRHIRKHKVRMPPAESPPAQSMPSPSGFSTSIHHQILIQQIDNVFNALSAVIETERTKLKALIGHGPFPEMRSSTDLQMPQQLSNDSPEAHHSGDGVVADVVRLSHQGVPPEEIARQLAISFNEVMLAIKMNTSNGNKGRARLEAVA
jgi:hypothetical protein